MPCSSEGYERSDLSRATSKLNDATRAACDMARVIRSNASSIFYLLNAETRAWIREHDEADARRLAREEEKHKEQLFRESALKKLSKAERTALGIRG